MCATILILSWFGAVGGVIVEAACLMLGGGGSDDVDLICMGLSASCGSVADLKLGLRSGDLELRLFSPSGSDLG